MSIFNRLHVFFLHLFLLLDWHWTLTWIQFYVLFPLRYHVWREFHRQHGDRFRNNYMAGWKVIIFLCMTFISGNSIICTCHVLIIVRVLFFIEISFSLFDLFFCTFLRWFLIISSCLPFHFIYFQFLRWWGRARNSTWSW
jgi:hypothetical protein